MNRYTSFSHFARTHGITHPAKEEWRLTTCLKGELRGLPGTRGTLVATNGMLCYVELTNDMLFLGHIDNFIVDAGEGEACKEQPVKRPSKRQQQHEQLMKQLIV